MLALDDALPEHVQSGRIRAAETYPHATDKTRFRAFLDNADNPADATLIFGRMIDG